MKSKQINTKSRRRVHLSTARVEKKLSALDVAEKIGKPEGYVYSIERGRWTPPLDVAVKWAYAIGMKPDAAFPELFVKESLT